MDFRYTKTKGMFSLAAGGIVFLFRSMYLKVLGLLGMAFCKYNCPFFTAVEESLILGVVVLGLFYTAWSLLE